MHIEALDPELALTILCQSSVPSHFMVLYHTFVHYFFIITTEYNWLLVVNETLSYLLRIMLYLAPFD